MRRFLLAAVMFGAAAGAQAADLPDLPILRGAFTEGPSTATVNWQGYYIGGQGGYGSSDEEFGRFPSTAPFLQGLVAGLPIGTMGASGWGAFPHIRKASPRPSRWG